MRVTEAMRLTVPRVEPELPASNHVEPELDPRARRLLALDDPTRISRPAIVLDPTPDIEQRIMELLFGIIDQVAQGLKPALVFDIDNTLLDTRYRTRAAAKAFEVDGVHPFLGPKLAQMEYDPRHTAATLKRPELGEAFAQFFDDFFWRKKSFDFDRPIAMTIAFAKLAKALGADIYFLTGRTETYRDLTAKRLAQLGLGEPDVEHLIMKPDKRDRHGRLMRTERFKARQLRKLHAKKIPIAGYMTEGSRDMRYLQQHVREVKRWLYLLFPIDEPGHQVSMRKTWFVPMGLKVPTEAAVRAAYELRS